MIAELRVLLFLQSYPDPDIRLTSVKARNEAIQLVNKMNDYTRKLWGLLEYNKCLYEAIEGFDTSELELWYQRYRHDPIIIQLFSCAVSSEGIDFGMINDMINGKYMGTLAI